MNTINKISLIALILFLIIIIGAIATKSTSLHNPSKETIFMLEQEYFRGQKDALEGNIKIKKDTAGQYIWIENQRNIYKY